MTFIKNKLSRVNRHRLNYYWYSVRLKQLECNILKT